jgi:hypothetical protein
MDLAVVPRRLHKYGVSDKLGVALAAVLGGVERAKQHTDNVLGQRPNEKNANPPDDALLSAAQSTRTQGQYALNRGRTAWNCDKCSDADCEHRLFSDLLKRAE